MEVSEVELHPEVDTSSDVPDHCQVIFFIFFGNEGFFFFLGFVYFHWVSIVCSVWLLRK